MGPVMFPKADTFSLDFHPIPYRGDPTGLDRHYLPRRGVAGPSIQTFFVLEQESRCLCYANANLTRTDQPGELMHFVEFWHTVTGDDPQWLYFDSKLVEYEELSRVNQRGISFITIRRRGAAILRRLEQLPQSDWIKATLDTPQRRHQKIRYVDEKVKLREYEGPIRQLAVDGLGRDKPTLFVTNNFDETARNIIIRYAGRNRVEDGLGISVNFFHLDCLASEIQPSRDSSVEFCAELPHSRAELRRFWTMNCPHCQQPSLVETMTKGGVLVDVCKICKGVWLDRGEVFYFSNRPKELERMLAAETAEPEVSSRDCPRCRLSLLEVPFLRDDLKVDRCPDCEGYWFDAGELNKAIEHDRQYFQLETDDFDAGWAGARWQTRAKTCSRPIAPNGRTCGCKTSLRGCSRCRTSGCGRPA